jgi:two-component system cell cycle sensor histidine kinase/response regulator CckA
MTGIRSSANGKVLVRGKFLRWFAISPERWRADLLALLLKASLVVSALVYLPNLYVAISSADLAVAIVDTLVVSAVFALFYSRVPFLFRAVAFCGAAYLFGTWLLLSTGSPSEVYLLGFSILTTLLLGLRAGLFSVLLNAATLIAGGYLRAAGAGIGESGFAGWPVSAFDFVLIDTFLTLAVGALLAVVESAVQREQVEVAMRNNERRFRALIEHSSNGIALLDANRKLVYLSPAVIDIEGYAPEELIGTYGGEHMHPDDLPLVAKVEQDLAKHPGKPFPVLWRRRHKRGHWIWVEGVVTNLLDDPAVGAIVTNYREVTERLLADRLLRDSEERLRVLNDLAEATRAVAKPDEIMPVALRVLGEHLGVSRCIYAVVDADGDGFTIPHDYTRGCASMVGHHRFTEFGRRSLREMGAGETLVVRNVDIEVRVAEDAAQLNAFSIKAIVCCSLVRKGEFRAMMAMHQSTPRDWSDTDIELLQAVAERCWAAIEGRAAAERLRLSEQHLRTVIDTTPECVTLVSPEGKIMETNAAGLAMKEADSHEQVIGLGIDKVVAPEDLPRVSLFHEAVCRGEGGRVTYDLVGLRGTRRTVEMISAPLKGADGRMQHLAISRDVTQTRRLEEQLRQAQKMEAIGQLAGGIAHDFNNLLTIVIGYCDILGEKKLLPPEDQELLDEIRKSGERAAALTRQLLAFSRKQVLEPRVLSLNAIVADMDRMLRRLIGEDVVLTSSLAPELLPVKVDAGQIEQVIVNLAVNARDAMPLGGRLIVETANVELGVEELRDHPGRLPGRYVAVAMTDTGTGMTAEVMDHIFEPFFTTKEPGRGTGLGLSVVHGIVEQSGGFLDVRSEVDSGTAFTIYLPAADGLVEYSGGQQADPNVVRGSGTVLLVEDQDELRRLLRRTLETHGYKVLEAANGQAALAVGRNYAGTIDAVVTDVVMPSMGGRELVEKLRTKQPDVRVLYISGHTDDAVVRHGVIDASHAFLQKPFPPAAFVSKVHELFAQRKPSKHLLFVDDEAPLVYLATRTLEERGYRVSGCGNGTDALAAFKRNPNAFDLVITDLSMRGMSGLELARALKELRPELPVILATGFIDDELRAKAAAVGVNELLGKPGTIEEFSDLVDRAAQRIA